MPYRRLPNTDSARLKAMYIALQKGRDLPPFKLAFSQNAFQKLQSLLPSYEHALSEHKNCYNIQLEKSKGFNSHFRKAKLYLSHFIQVVNMGITRGDLPAATRSYFGLPEDDKKMPPLNTDDDVMHWGMKLIEGEQKRKMEGKTTITNPSIALVKVHYDKFQEFYVYQNGLKKRTLRAQQDLQNKRNQSDQVIQQIWNEVENTFKDLPDDLKREKASEYGLIYFYRKNELTNMDLFKDVRINIS
jgi:hypothetical protein